jgi:DNA helicase-2/ATP-dependent DNA helicase PcrA
MEITAVTFTNKAANEMKKRLAVLLGPKDADALILGKLSAFNAGAWFGMALIEGTFHATCARYLRRYGQLIDLPNNFSITDADDWSATLSTPFRQS